MFYIDLLFIIFDSIYLLSQNARSEQEDEYRVNKLAKTVEQVKKEKQELVRQVEQEEEYITNTLVKKLEQVHISFFYLL